MNKKWELSDNVDHDLMESLLLEEGKVVKKSPAKLVTFHETSDGDFYVKRSRHAPFIFRPQKYWFKDCPSRWEWSVARTAQSLDVPVVDHLAICEIWSSFGLQEDILITRAFDGEPLHITTNVDPHRVMKFVKMCHEKGMVHGDLHSSNLLVNESTGEFRLVDLKGVCFKQNADPKRQRLDIAYLNMNFPMPLSEGLLKLSKELRRKKMADRSRRCLKDNREFGQQVHGGSKWWVRKLLSKDSLNQVLETPDAFCTGDSLLKDGLTCTVGQYSGYVIKRYNLKKLLNLIKDLFRSTKAKRGFQLGYHLELVGVATPRVIAAAEYRFLGFALRSYFIMEKIEGSIELAEVNKSGSSLAKHLGNLIGKMHYEGFSHRDLKTSNILVDTSSRPLLIDLDGLKYEKKVPIRIIKKNLNRLIRDLRKKNIFSEEIIKVFLDYYNKSTGLYKIHINNI